ncbi:general transcription factor IIH subunit 2-like isoform X1 [Cavia porcellus]|uniref:general transcription factor IIH subunit 2-like isoform X1 n=1 Tax=Cavia porcellus TaxID=10141 RepID=UPI000661CCCA
MKNLKELSDGKEAMRELGTYHEILDESHYKELLTHHVSPPPASSSSECSLIHMGFPQHTIAALADQDAKPSFSMAHLDSSSEPGLALGGYFYPQCWAKYCELPVECKMCGLTLVSAPHLAWLYHHLFPLDAFQEIPLEEYKGERFCYGCQGQLKDQHVYVCIVFQNVFCVDCDVFVHDSVHCCPGCIHKIPIPSENERPGRGGEEDLQFDEAWPRKCGRSWAWTPWPC